jgi:dTDP-4-amino-4,6-dideoxygalactose transaminase
MRQATQSTYFGFFKGHSYLAAEDLERVSKLIGSTEDEVVADFEKQFALLIGSGAAFAYAAARMGFFEIMRLRGIKEGDEVILPGATCAVMVNAVMRIGAIPVYADIDPNTFGSSCEAIAARISPKTRMIVAQHSFGIPCNIEPIIHLAKDRNIFLLEDCALTLGSKVNGTAVGNFGDAALFSTDHSKPLNTLIGGLVYTKNTELANLLRASQANYPHLSIVRQNNLWSRLLLEAHYCTPSRFGRLGLIDLFGLIVRKMGFSEGDLLTDDLGSMSQSTYPYPARLPVFLAAIGLIELRRWSKVSLERAESLKRLIAVVNKSSSGCYLPAAYKDRRLEIVPLRLAWSEPSGSEIRKVLKSFIHTSGIWFMKPIVATKLPLTHLGYIDGSCPISESIGPKMVNVPCIFGPQDRDMLIAKLKTSII